MSRPNPVVGIAAKFPYAVWWRAYQSDIFIAFGDKQEVLISFIKGFNPGILPGFFCRVFLKGIAVAVYFCLAFAIGHSIGNTLQHLCSYIFNSHDEFYEKPFIGKFFF